MKGTLRLVPAVKMHRQTSRYKYSKGSIKVMISFCGCTQPSIYDWSTVEMAIELQVIRPSMFGCHLSAVSRSHQISRVSPTGGAPVTQQVRRWLTDLAAPGSSPAWVSDPFNHKRASTA